MTDAGPGRQDHGDLSRATRRARSQSRSFASALAGPEGPRKPSGDASCRPGGSRAADLSSGRARPRVDSSASSQGLGGSSSFPGSLGQSRALARAGGRESKGRGCAAPHWRAMCWRSSLSHRWYTLKGGTLGLYYVDRIRPTFGQWRALRRWEVRDHRARSGGPADGHRRDFWLPRYAGHEQHRHAVAIAIGCRRDRACIALTLRRPVRRASSSATSRKAAQHGGRPRSPIAFGGSPARSSPALDLSRERVADYRAVASRFALRGRSPRRLPRARRA
jgi:hypothetical protein